ncbi:arrestin family protein 1 [Trichoderma asperellum]|uniref:Arrestin family protein 1 n=2 Tax=Trichoderma asperellum TaxID=101201 RepID=A0A6V8R2K7_TRIAP|nr:arrestin family protein 1 [Trichoderma asperellum]
MRYSQPHGPQPQIAILLRLCRAGIITSHSRFVSPRRLIAKDGEAASKPPPSSQPVAFLCANIDTIQRRRAEADAILNSIAEPLLKNHSVEAIRSRWLEPCEPENPPGRGLPTPPSHRPAERLFLCVRACVCVFSAADASAALSAFFHRSGCDDSMATTPASVRVSGPPNRSFLVGYPGISATLPRIEGKVEIRPGQGFSMPVPVSLVRICLQKRETIHPDADSLTKRHLGAPRKETTDVVGKEVLLFRCSSGKDAENVYSMDLPFIIFIPFGRGGEETNRRIPPASLQLPSRIAETYYELVVTVQQGHSNQYRYSFPLPLLRYDTLSTFGMYNKPETRQITSDNLVHLAINLPRWSYGPNDPITVYIKIAPNLDWWNKAKKVTIDKITLGIEEEITFNPEGDEPTKKVNKLAKQVQVVKTKLPEAGYATNIGLVFPAKDLRDSEGIIKRGRPAFPQYEVASFTTSSTLYKIEFYLSIKVQVSGARDLHIRQPIVICPLDQQGCKEEMDAIEIAAREASHVDPNNPMVPARSIVLANDRDALRALGLCTVGGQKKPFIE